MKTRKTDVKYVEWFGADVMHSATRNWLSELLFAKDEQLFFDDLIKTYTLKLIEEKHFKRCKNIIERLVGLQKETDKLISSLKSHEKNLKIMVDNVDEFEKEDKYKSDHRAFNDLISDYFENYKAVKKQLFRLIKGIKKENKQKLLLE
ncbi:hypothetical protein [Mariniflexile sp.]|uniref:hypothetical protein n=1 Tax=Mariniflexile sp. TaxID=1979402 RepID=UPI003563492B